MRDRSRPLHTQVAQVSTTTFRENVWYESELRAEGDEETPTYAMRVVPTFDDVVGECAEGVEVLPSFNASSFNVNVELM